MNGINMPLVRGSAKSPGYSAVHLANTCRYLSCSPAFVNSRPDLRRSLDGVGTVLLFSTSSNLSVMVVSTFFGVANFRYKHRNIGRKFASCLVVGSDKRRSTRLPRVLPASGPEILCFSIRELGDGVSSSFDSSSDSSSIFRNVR